MIRYIFSPKWFYGVDIAFELFSMIITFLIARYGYELYKISGNKKHKYFSLFFLLIGIAFLFKIIANFDIYYVNTVSIEIANSIFYFTTSHVSEMLFILGFSIFKFLMLLSFFGLLYILWDEKPGIFWLSLYFILIITIFSHGTYYIFHLSMTMILAFLLSYYYRNYAEKSSRESFLIMLSFLMLTLSQLAFITIALDMVMYVVGETLQLIGYAILLYHYILVTRYEK
ncbi:MAG: hypothetical protein DRP11_01645 [Candidatus Aenigmatarchaeota archaeon]|nr:MAG: hypothetical protein DRP11_01645 [Candidatus Aenigmarchaeota archaeon]